MNRETESHFSNVPFVEKQRSKFKRPHTHKTTWNTGDLIPIYVDADILPGDTVSMDMGSVVRMATPLYPVMDNANMDVYFFFVPHRLVWEHWREFWGENRTTYWEQQVEYEIPQITSPALGWDPFTLADYMGIPTHVNEISVNHLPFRAYCQIVNDWFRDQNLKDPCMINTDETTLTGTNSGDYVTNTQLGAKPFKAAKYHDYFTSALPEPQKGPDVTIPLGKLAPVITMDDEHQGNLAPLKWRDTVGDPLEEGYQNIVLANPVGGPVRTIINANVSLDPDGWGIKGIKPSNLYTNLNAATSATINELRQAFAIQRFYEAQARGGSRYIEFIKNIFGVSSPDARQQRAEYLGGYRCPINVTQVLQTSSTDATSPLGGTGAFSYTPDRESVFTHSFTEHGTLMGLAVIRTDHTYQQGLERMWSRKKWTDFYVPQFANLGEQAILNKEIYLTGTSTDKEAFGYQEAWADYRYKPNRVSGAFRSNYTGTLDSWHYADDYSSLPYLSSDWIDETDANVARTLSVQDEPQFIGDFYFDATYTRVMPIYSVPGLLDHH